MGQLHETGIATRFLDERRQKTLLSAWKSTASCCAICYVSLFGVVALRFGAADRWILARHKRAVTGTVRQKHPHQVQR